MNYAEVVTKLIERGSSLDQAQAALRAIALTTVDFDVGLALRTGELRSETKRRSLSLGDRACLSLADREGVPAVTGDRNWTGAVARIKVQLFR